MLLSTKYITHYVRNLLISAEVSENDKQTKIAQVLASYMIEFNISHLSELHE